MQKYLTFVFILLFTASIFAQHEPPQPFEEFGVKVKVLTLSNGKYCEFFPNDTIYRFGTVMFNHITGEVESVVFGDTLYGEYNLKPDVVCRWLSPDPLGAQFPNWSPYNFVLNNPIRMVDPTGLAPDDYVYYNSKGNEIGRIADSKVQQVVIIADENLQKFDNLPYGRESIDDAATMGKTYDVSPMLGFFNDNRSDYFDNAQPTFITANGDAPKNIPVERAIPLYEKNGVVTIGKNEPVSKGGERVVGINPGQIPEERVNAVKNSSQSGFLHTEPVNERNSKYSIGSPTGGFSPKGYSPNPSSFDEANYKPSAGFHSVIVRPKEVVFFTTKSDYFVVPKTKL